MAFKVQHEGLYANAKTAADNADFADDPSDADLHHLQALISRYQDGSPSNDDPRNPRDPRRV